MNGILLLGVNAVCYTWGNSEKLVYSLSHNVIKATLKIMGVSMGVKLTSSQGDDHSPLAEYLCVLQSKPHMLA